MNREAMQKTALIYTSLGGLIADTKKQRKRRNERERESDKLADWLFTVLSLISPIK
jgi:hypothetical protein